MKRILFILTVLFLSSLSLSAQWTCKTLDPEFDNALKIAYTEMNNRAQLMIGEYMLMEKYENFGSQQFSGPDDMWDLIDIGEYDKEEIEKMIADYRDYSKENQLYTQFLNLGNIPIVLEGNFRYYSNDNDYYAVYSFEVSFKVGEIFKKYKSENDFYISYKYDRNSGMGCYCIEWPSKDFWKDFRAASSVKIRIKHNRDSDFQYYEFNMSGSSKAFNYVTAGHRVVWEEDVAEGYGDYLDEILVKMKVEQLRRIKVEEAEEAERQKELEALTPPHKLKFECVEREFGFTSYDFSFYETPNELAVVCPSIRDSVFPPDHLDYNLEGDSLLMALGICSCANDIIFSENAEEFLIKTYQDSLWLYSSERERNPFDTLVSFDYFISQYKRYGKHFCGFYLQSNDGSYNDTIIPGYKVSWAQTPLRLIITTNNTVQEFYVMDWSFDKVSLFPDSYQWTYHVKSDKEDNEYKFCIWRKIIDSDSWMSDMGDEMKLNWDEFFSKNIGFKFVYIGESFNKLKITK